MKRALLTIVLLLMVACGYSQSTSYTQKWNDLYKRTEFFDSYGNLQGWAKYNDLYKRWELFNSNSRMIGYYQWNDLYKRWEYHESAY